MSVSNEVDIVKIKGLATRLQKAQRRAVRPEWVDLNRALSSNRASQGWVTHRFAVHETDQAALIKQAAVMTVSPQAILLAAARLLIARYLPDCPSHCFALVHGSGTNGHVAVPLASPGRQVVAELLGDSEGWLNRAKRAIDPGPRIIVRVSSQDSPQVEDVTSPERQLSLDIEISSSAIEIAAVATAAVFSKRSLQDLIDQLWFVARQLADLSAQAPLEEVCALPSSQQALLLNTWGRSPSSDNATFVFPHVALEEHAGRHPDDVAVALGNRTMSYGELNRRANQVAHCLLARGVRFDDRIAICVDRGFEMVIGLLAVLKVGAAYVPLDPAYPAERLAYMVQDCAPAAVLTQSALLSRFSAPGVSALPLDELVPELADQPACNPQRVEHDLDHLAYVIYTSGSTGKPKGACVTCRGLSNLLHWYIDELNISSDDRFLVVTSFSFDLTQKNILAPLCKGARVHLSEHRFDPVSTLAEIAHLGITAVNLTPSYFYGLAECDSGNALSGLRYAVLGGEPISLSRLAQPATKYPQLEFINSYGPTECSDVVAAFRMGRDWGEYGAASPPIGRPIPHTRLYVLDAYGRLAPPGVTGEIHVAGAGVGRGYLHQAELTNRHFVSDAFSHASDATMYRTGDLGRWRSDGNLDYLGRSDSQVKVRGFRVELGEIEAQLASCPGVREAVVHCHDDGMGGKHLVAYLVGHAEADLSETRMRARLAEALPDFMVPGIYVTLPALPLTPSGKVDRRALPEPEQASHLARAYVAPATQTESLLCDIWQALLKRGRIGVTEDFFEVGGHSLLATRLLAAIAEQMHVALSIVAIFEHKTIREQARLVDAFSPARSEAHPPMLPPMQAGAEREELVL
ncbi:MAG: amino acid adenylation domain-containing protein [Alcaligenaceae bacterium]|nr:MAG: amino acid adenylation domain-containing protein [Alcaligenaceae bacterium]